MSEEKTNLTNSEKQDEGFGDLLKYTFMGYGAGLFFGIFFDYFGFQRSAFGQWIVRSLAGESESVVEGIYVIRQRLRQASSSMAEAYGWGKFVGIIIPWFIDFSSRISGVNVYGIEGFYIPYFYALSDQIGANVSGLIFLRKKERSWSKVINRYTHHPVMLTSLMIILIVPLGLLLVRILGFIPTTQVYTALETIGANLCWLPPLIGWFIQREKEVNK